MIVRLVFEQQQPGLVRTVVVHGDAHAAGVDLVGFVHVLQHAGLFQVLSADGAQVHQAYGLVFARVHLPAQRKITLPCGLHRLVLDLHVVQDGAEGGVAAMVAPIGVDHTDLGDRGVPMLAFEIALAEGDVALVHGQAVALHKIRKAGRVQRGEALQCFHGGWDGVIGLQCGLLRKGRLPSLYGVDDVFFNFSQLLRAGRAVQQEHAGGLHVGPLALADELDALGGAGRALIELAGQELGGEHRVRAFGHGRIGEVQLRLTEHGAAALGKQLFGDALHVVAVQQAQARHAFDAQQMTDLGQNAPGLHCVFGTLFHINAIYHNVSSLWLTARQAPSGRCPSGGAAPQSRSGPPRRRPRPRRQTANPPRR